MNENIAPHDKFVTITYFVREMLGRRSRDWFYDHVNDEGMPQRVTVGDKVMLSFEDCTRYIEQLKSKAKVTAPRKRGRGRPRKIRQLPA